MQRTVPAAVPTDLVCVILFCAIGRRSHAEGLTAAGVAETAWPFLSGALAGWLIRGAGATRQRSFPPVSPCGWPPSSSECCCAASLPRAQRVSFIVVASLVTALLLLGWRAVAALVVKRSG